MSALPPRADNAGARQHVRFVPIADMTALKLTSGIPFANSLVASARLQLLLFLHHRKQSFPFFGRFGEVHRLADLRMGIYANRPVGTVHPLNKRHPASPPAGLKVIARTGLSKILS